MGILVIFTVKQILIVKLKFQKSKLISGKVPLFVMGPFCTPYSICLNIRHNSFVWKCQFFNRNTFRRNTFLQVVVFQKIWFKDEVLKAFKIPNDYRIRICWSIKPKMFELFISCIARGSLGPLYKTSLLLTQRIWHLY